MMDVAKLAGVSHQTVSRVINGSERVAGATRERVNAAMRELDYQPSVIARALKTGRSRTIGVISFATNLYGPASTLFAIERAAHAADYFTSIVSLPELNEESLSWAIERLRRLPVDGILVIAPQRTAVQAVGSLSPGIPLVAVEAGPEDRSRSVVAVDQFGGGVLATRHLLELGHRTVFHVAGPPDWQEAELRLAGWRSAREQAGRPAPEPLAGDWSPEVGYELGGQLAPDRELTAIFVANDQMALGVLRALQEEGRRVPEDVSVVGFDGIPEGGFFMPPLTTVWQDFTAMGSRGFEVLLAEMEGEPGEAHHEVIQPELIVRASTARPP
jgi:DNA-binding LacI/PurR family transcriptional regulator